MKKITFLMTTFAITCFISCSNGATNSSGDIDSTVVENDSAANAVSIPIEEGDSISEEAAQAAASLAESQGRGQCRFCSCTSFRQRPGYYQCWCGHQSFVHND